MRTRLMPLALLVVFGGCSDRQSSALSRPGEACAGDGECLSGASCVDDLCRGVTVIRGNVWLGTLAAVSPVHIALFELSALDYDPRSIRLADAVMDLELTGDLSPENSIPFVLENVPAGGRALVGYVIIPDADPEFRVGLAIEVVVIDELGAKVAGVRTSSIELFTSTAVALRP